MRVLGYDELSVLLHVGHPLLMLDCLSVDDGFGMGCGRKAVSLEEPSFLGHFPGRPVMPGVLAASAMAQVAQALYVLREGRAGVVTGVRRVKFRKPVFPGMVLRIECARGMEQPDGTAEYSAKVFSGEELMSCGTVYLAPCAEGYYAVLPEDASRSGEPCQPLDAGQLLGAVPHRYPFLLLDGVQSLELSGELVGMKNVTGSGRYVAASAPAHFPGLLQVESMAQLGCAAVLSREEYRGCYGFFMSIDSARFYAPALPGDSLRISLTCEMAGHGGYGSGAVRAGGRLLTEASIKFAIVSSGQSDGASKGINEAFYIRKS